MISQSLEINVLEKPSLAATKIAENSEESQCPRITGTNTFKTPKSPQMAAYQAVSNNKWINSQSPLKNFSAQGVKRIGEYTPCSSPASVTLKKLFFQYNFNLMTEYQFIMVMTSCC